MAQTTTTTDKKPETPFSNPFITEQMWQDLGLASWTDRVQNMGETQARNFRHMTEQFLHYGRQLSDQIGAQTQVTAKLMKDSFDYSIELMDAWRKVVLDSTQRTLDNVAPKK